MHVQWLRKTRYLVIQLDNCFP
uniref:Uncharacterized protein n=1 Tax=Anguilla anguilla TaxID=7936 RepID=A0A0E9TI37_ANGAN